MSDESRWERPDPALRVRVAFDFAPEATWGELRAYVMACSFIPDAAPVGINRDREDGAILGLEEEQVGRLVIGGERL